MNWFKFCIGFVVGMFVAIFHILSKEMDTKKSYYKILSEQREAKRKNAKMGPNAETAKY